MNLAFQPVDTRLRRILHHDIAPYPIVPPRSASRVVLRRYATGEAFGRWKMLAGMPIEIVRRPQLQLGWSATPRTYLERRGFLLGDGQRPGGIISESAARAAFRRRLPLPRPPALKMPPYPEAPFEPPLPPFAEPSVPTSVMPWLEQEFVSGIKNKYLAGGGAVILGIALLAGAKKR